jgi:hypothetical protein
MALGTLIFYLTKYMILNSLYKNFNFKQSSYKTWSELTRFIHILISLLYLIKVGVIQVYNLYFKA